VSPWIAAFWTFVVLAGLLALYGLHRLALWMEERGHIYYLHKKPKGSAVGCFVAFQQAIEPRVEHVLKVDRVNQQFIDDIAEGDEHPPNALPTS
jgi:hypothetical protein